MGKEKHKLRPISEVSMDVLFKSVTNLLKLSLFLPKKHLRAAWRIIKNPHLEAEIMENGKPVKRTFHYGFRRFFIMTKDKKREILAPHPQLQMVFEAVKDWLERISSPHENAYGFIKGRNPKKAVEALLKSSFPLFRNKHFLRFDILDAFPNITLGMVENVLRRLKVNEVVAKVLAWLVTYDYQGQRRLPQGSSCSPIILNLVYLPMCEELTKICGDYAVKLAIYADDFSFAAPAISRELRDNLLAVPPKYGFQVKDEKTKDNLGKTIPQILGLTIVKGKIHIRRLMKKKFRRIMYAATEFNAYSPQQIQGVTAYIRSIYGKEKNWPGWLLRPLKEYQAKQVEGRE